MTFTSKEDVWNVIDLLIEEVNEQNEKGKEFDVAKSIYSQLPFFCCINVVFDKEIQKDIQREHKGKPGARSAPEIIGNVVGIQREYTW